MAAHFERHPFLLSVEDVADTLHTDVEKGLTALQVQQLSRTYPPNELTVEGVKPWYSIFARQLFNAMIVVSPLSPLHTQHPAKLIIQTNSDIQRSF